MSKSDPSPAADNLPFASELVKARNDLGLTQSQLSTQSEVSLSAIKGYETGRTVPGTRELRDLCRALRVTPNKLLFGVETPFTPLAAEDLANSPSEKGAAVQRGRIAFLASLLSFDESYAIYSLAHSIAVARHGEMVVRDHFAAADLVTSVRRVDEGKGAEIDLLPKNPAFVRELIAQLEYALRVSEANGQSSGLSIEPAELVKKVSKKYL